tara:strand:- start:9553 stop:10518 length:966 start_codon:yes stop_codon:yes gene_type:complete
MSIYTIKTHSLFKFSGLFFAIIYGFFIFGSVQYLYSVGSGDIGSYVDFFTKNTDSAFLLQEYSVLSGDVAFRVLVISLGNYVNVAPITVLSYLAFIISSLVFCIYAVHIRSSKYLIYILPLFLMIFFTPMVSNLFNSSLRSGLSFTILMISFVYFNGFWKYVLFGLSVAIHLSMAPIIALYVLYHMLKRTRIKSPFIVPFFALALTSFSIVVASYVLKVNVTPIDSSNLYNVLILFIGLLIIFTNKKVIKDIHGFMSIGIILIYLFGFIIDLSFSRYIGNAIILYLFFLIEKGELGTIQVFTAGYIPFFFLVSFYSISNIL